MAVNLPVQCFYLQEKFMPALPLILFGSLSLLSGLLALQFPETLNTILPDTVEEAENIGKNIPKTVDNIGQNTQKTS